MKRLSAFWCILFLCMFLGSCSLWQGRPENTSGAGSSDGASDASAASGESADGSAEAASVTQNGVTIAIRTRLSGAEEDAMQMLAEDFNASNGQGITVVVHNTVPAEEEIMPEDDTVYGEDPEAEPVQEAPDAALLLDDVETVRATRGLQSLNERFTGEFGNDPDVPQSLRAASEVGGERFGVPFDIDGEVFFYNATLYDKHELTPPETWEELLHAAEVLAGEESCPALTTDSLTDLSDLLLRLKGCSLTEGKRAGFGNPAGEEAFSFLLSLLNDDGLLLADRGTCREQFLAGQCAGYIGKGSDLTDMFRTSSFSIGAIPVPVPKGSNTACAPCTMRVLALYPGEEEEQDAAWAFVRYLTTPSVSARWAVATGHFPVRSAAYLEPEYESYMETSVAAKASAGARYGYYLPQPYSEDLQYRVREIIGRNMKSNVTGPEIAQILLEEINDSLANE